MPTGASQPFYLQDQPSPPFQLELENSYFLVKLHDVQAFFQANFLKNADSVIFSSSITSSFQPNSPTQNLYKINEAFHNSQIEGNPKIHLCILYAVRVAVLPHSIS